MHSTTPWGDYFVAVTAILVVYYTWFAFRFYRRQIKSFALSGGAIWGGQPRGQPAEPERGTDPASAETAIMPDRQFFSQLIGLGGQLADLIEEAHQKSYNAQELSLLLQMVLKDYPGIHSRFFRFAINEFIDNQCSKYGSILENSVKLTTPFQFKLTTCSG